MKKEVEYVIKQGRAAERIVFVWNPRSSRAIRVKEVAYQPIFDEFSDRFKSYEVTSEGVIDNARRLSEILRDEDAVIVAGGDGTALVALNAVMESGKDVVFYALPFGNFNDMSRLLQRNRGGIIRPLRMKVNGRHFEYAACYFTVGMMAEATEIFDAPEIREKLRKTGKSRLIFSVFSLIKWYFKHKKCLFIPPVKIEGEVFEGLSDVMVVNGVTVAKVLKGDRDLAFSKKFVFARGRLTSFFRLTMFMLKGVFSGVPGDEKTEIRLEFLEPAEIEIQAEGEYKRLTGVKSLEFLKSNREVKIL